ncbi:Protein tyrosine phosphatase domain-containing protein 1 [Halocaridina rubra]|uniref:Protein tyrosine phosphatase domain-containing protein 1 n=1 Tax=Halocaridina rubra TaxID=373956 RepID=A0AAN8WRE9_HALRR
MSGFSGTEVEELRPAGLSGNKRETAVHSNYNKISEQLRQLTPTEVQCSVFCGGRRCKYDNFEAWSAKDMAINGIYSHWVTDGILAMARPNTDIMQKKDIVGQFLKHDIKTIINLQIGGEHASCGAPLNESGFSYEPSLFMEHGNTQSITARTLVKPQLECRPTYCKRLIAHNNP